MFFGNFRNSLHILCREFELWQHNIAAIKLRIVEQINFEESLKVGYLRRRQQLTVNRVVAPRVQYARSSIS